MCFVTLDYAKYFRIKAVIAYSRIESFPLLSNYITFTILCQITQKRPTFVYCKHIDVCALQLLY